MQSSTDTDNNIQCNKSKACDNYDVECSSFLEFPLLELKQNISDDDSCTSSQSSFSALTWNSASVSSDLHIDTTSLVEEIANLMAKKKHSFEDNRSGNAEVQTNLELLCRKMFDFVKQSTLNDDVATNSPELTIHLRRVLDDFVCGKGRRQRRKPRRNPSFDDSQIIDHAAPRIPTRSHEELSESTAFDEKSYSKTKSPNVLPRRSICLDGYEENFPIGCNPNFEKSPVLCHSAPSLPRRSNSYRKLKDDSLSITAASKQENASCSNREEHLDSTETTEAPSITTDLESPVAPSNSKSISKPSSKQHLKSLGRPSIVDLSLSVIPTGKRRISRLSNISDGSAVRRSDTAVLDVENDLPGCDFLAISQSPAQHNKHELPSQAALLSSSVDDEEKTSQKTLCATSTSLFNYSYSINEKGIRRNRCFVRFSTVHVRVYERIMSDNPCSVSGPSIGIGWRYFPLSAMNVEMFEQKQAGNRRYGSQLLVSRREREKIAVAVGNSRKDVIRNVREKCKVKQKRLRTVSNLKAEKFELALEKARKKIHIFLSKKLAITAPKINREIIIVTSPNQQISRSK